MNPPASDVDQAIHRLSENLDFQTFLQWLEDEREAALEQLLISRDTVFVHQLQGSSLVLADIKRAVMLANTRG